jgi:hypothetical protein
MFRVSNSDFIAALALQSETRGQSETLGPASAIPSRRRAWVAPAPPRWRRRVELPRSDRGPSLSPPGPRIARTQQPALRARERWQADCSTSCPPQEPGSGAPIHSNTLEAGCPSNRVAVSRRASFRPRPLLRTSRRTRTALKRSPPGGGIQSPPLQPGEQRPKRGVHRRNGKHPSLLACFATSTSPITGRRPSEGRTSRCAGTFLCYNRDTPLDICPRTILDLNGLPPARRTASVADSKGSRSLFKRGPARIAEAVV